MKVECMITSADGKVFSMAVVFNTSVGKRNGGRSCHCVAQRSKIAEAFVKNGCL